MKIFKRIQEFPRYVVACVLAVKFGKTLPLSCMVSEIFIKKIGFYLTIRYKNAIVNNGWGINIICLVSNVIVHSPKMFCPVGSVSLKPKLV